MKHYQWIRKMTASDLSQEIKGWRMYLDDEAEYYYNHYGVNHE